MVWYSWNTDSSSTTCASAWGAWNYSDSNSASMTGITTSAVWTSWTCGSQTGTADAWGCWVGQTGQVYVGAPQLSAEERERQAVEARRLAEESRQRAEAARLEKEAADLKALELLQDILTEDDFAFYQKHGRLLVKGRKFDYLIQRDSGAVNRLEKGKVADLCMHLENHHAYSRHDNVIAMKLFLEGREDEFNREANLHRKRDPEGVEVELMRAVG